MPKNFLKKGAVPLIPLIVGAVILITAVVTSYIYQDQPREIRSRAQAHLPPCSGGFPVGSCCPNGLTCISTIAGSQCIGSSCAAATSTPTRTPTPFMSPTRTPTRTPTTTPILPLAYSTTMFRRVSCGKLLPKRIDLYKYNCRSSMHRQFLCSCNLNSNSYSNSIYVAY